MKNNNKFYGTLLNSDNRNNSYNNYCAGYYYPKILAFNEKPSTIYCAGFSKDYFIHDLMISKENNGTLFIYDNSQESKDFYKTLKEVLSSDELPDYINEDNDSRIFWIEVLNNRIPLDKIHFADYNLSDVTSNDKLSRSIHDIMCSFNHTSINALRLNNNEDKCNILNTMLNINIMPRYLSVDFRITDDVGKSAKYIEKLEKYGYKIFNNENFNISFIKT